MHYMHDILSHTANPNPPTMETDASQQIVQDTATNPPAMETDATQQIVQDTTTNPPAVETDASQQIVQDTATNPPAMETDASQQIVQDTATNPPAMETDATQHIVQDTATLNLLAKQRGFMVRDVAHDGNCLFTAVETQLPRYGIHCDGESLREQLVTYLEHYPFTHDGTCHLREFIAAPVVSTDPYSADTEAPNDQDECINSIEDANI